MTVVDGVPVSCGFKSIVAEHLEQMAVEKLEQIGWDKDTLTHVVREAEIHAKKSAAALKEEKRDLDINIKSVRRDLDNLRPLLEASPKLDLLAEEIKKLKVVEQELENHLQKLDKRIAFLESAVYAVASAQKTLQGIGQVLKELSIPRKVSIIRSLV